MIVYNVERFLSLLKQAAEDEKTIYVLGGIGYLMTPENKRRVIAAYDYNARRYDMIMSFPSDGFGFDCVNLIKGILWGWIGDKNKTYGGAVWFANGVPDANETAMWNSYCYDKSADFSNIVPGEFVWKSGHCGVYVGNGLVIECTPNWKNGVQYTNLGNVGIADSSLPVRSWTGHGKLPWIDYTQKEKKNGCYWEDGNLFLYDNGVQKVDEGEYFVDGGYHWVDIGGVAAHDKDVHIPYVFKDEDKWSDEEKRKVADAVGGVYADYLYKLMKTGAGKWCRFDHDGNMVYGFSRKNGEFYYFEPVAGAMVKDEITINAECVFDTRTGILKNLYYAD